MINEISERQGEIINAAGKLLTDSGVGGLTTKNLALEMGFSEAAIYRHFKNKESIIVAMLTFLAKTMDENFVRVVNANDNPEEQMVKLFKSQFDFFSANRHFVVAVFSDGLMEKSDTINNALLKIMAVKVKHLKPIIESGQNIGVFTNEISTEELMHIVMGAFRLKMFKYRVSKFDFNLQKDGQELIQSILILIKV